MQMTEWLEYTVFIAVLVLIGVAAGPSIVDWLLDRRE
jgi:hypothetical protein